MAEKEVKLVERKYEFYIGEFRYDIVIVNSFYGERPVRLLETNLEGETKKMFEGDLEDLQELADGINSFIRNFGAKDNG